MRPGITQLDPVSTLPYQKEDEEEEEEKEGKKNIDLEGLRECSAVNECCVLLQKTGV